MPDIAVPDIAEPDIAAPEDPLLLRDLAVAVAERVADHVRTRRPEVFGPPGAAPVGDAVRAKSTPTDPVTVVDTEAEVLTRELLARHRPADRLVGEEGSGDPAAVDGLRWVVDPIDGTVNFLYGIPAYAVSLAVQWQGVTVAGAVVDVPHAETYSAARGYGAECSTAAGRVRLRCSAADDLALALVGTGFGYSGTRRAAQARLVGELLPHVRDIRRIGSAALDLCALAAGRLDGFYEHGLSPWDWAAAALVATEAGCRVMLPSAGTPGSAGAILVAAAPGVAGQLIQALRAADGLEPIR
ncbi:inositol monophosphatase family protein [Skermania piniformis]|uniref:inositol monophosphatase family protein n=2 Tax=Skermania pinensis TaxID=39122 RepID=UPI003570F5EF